MMKDLIDSKQLGIEHGIPTRNSEINHRPSTIDHIMVLNPIHILIVEIPLDMYMRSDYNRVCWEIDEVGNKKWKTLKELTISKKI
jgi:hypothetical protein